MTPLAGHALAVPPPPRPWLLRGPALLCCVALAAAWIGSEGSLSRLLGAEARAALGEFARGFFPPAHSPEFLGMLWRPLLETVAIAFLGLALALVAAFPLGLAAIHPSTWEACGLRVRPWHRALHVASRLVLSLLRAIPEVIWALVFVRAVGLGAPAGVLALAAAYTGVLGKVFAEIVESTPHGAAQALGGAGAPPVRALLLATVPAARPTLVSYLLYRFDCALRASAVLGIVGAGGVGLQIELSLKMLAYDEVATLVIALFAMVAAADALSALVRRRLAARRSLFPATRPALARDLGRGAALAGAAVLAAAFLGVGPATVLSREALGGMGEFLGQLFPPDLSLAGLRPIPLALAETLAVSVLGTAIAAAGGLALAFVAARPPFTAPATGIGAALGSAARLAARGVMNLSRTLPELLWALAFVFAVGLGPFAGALAIGVHTAGVLGRLYVEVLDEVPPGPLESLRAAGASRAATLALGAIPQAFPQLAAYTLYRWEVNVRAAAVLGVVGAGGLGRDLKLALSWFDYPRAATLILTLLAAVAAVDLFSGSLRARLGGFGTARRDGCLPPAERSAVE
jgi:phosphonate transport system permease protein